MFILFKALHNNCFKMEVEAFNMKVVIEVKIKLLIKSSGYIYCLYVFTIEGNDVLCVRTL